MLHLRSLAGTYLSIPVDNSSTLTDIQTSILQNLSNVSNVSNVSKTRVIVFVDRRFVQNATQLSPKYAIMTHQSKIIDKDNKDNIDGMFFIDTSPMVYRCLRSLQNGRTILPLVYESEQRFVHLKMATLTTQNVITLANKSGQSLWSYKTFTPGSTISMKIDLLEWTVDLMLSSTTIYRTNIIASSDKELYIITNGLQLREMCPTETKAYDAIRVADNRTQFRKWCQKLRI